MTKLFLTLLLILSQYYFSQKEITIEIQSPDLKIDSIFISYPGAARNTHLLHRYQFSAVGMKSIGDQGDIKIAFNKDLMVASKVSYPQPVSISYYDAATNAGMQSRPFFIDRENLKIRVLDEQLNFELLSPTKSNLEYDKLSKHLANYDTLLKPFENNDPKTIAAKEAERQRYIRKNPKSSVAFWTLVDDFSKYGYHPMYLENLKLFDLSLKNTFAYTEFAKLLKLESEKIFPDVNPDNRHQISKSTFTDHKLTLIDYWSTTCKPCIEDLPKLVRLYDFYKSQGVQFISVTDEQTPERIRKAEQILQTNRVTWQNYFDTNKEFPAKLNAAGYPLQILVDSEGHIVKRTYGELDAIEAFLKDYVK